MKEIKLPSKFSSSNKQIPKGSTVIAITKKESVMIDNDGNHVRINPITRRKEIIRKNSNQNEA